ncbi:hypothetical protein AVEN_187294-1 [Araneus ventricosus]|uniref:Uncharacterized protein n=1 Tax=Araneus ventricosus TaxID=182803 RepID=A0A4Y2U3Z0_ARAVE|nr:hypothetical protein AVEN_187294-1 [Araneus ventricosus]
MLDGIVGGRYKGGRRKKQRRRCRKEEKEEKIQRKKRREDTERKKRREDAKERNEIQIGELQEKDEHFHILEIKLGMRRNTFNQEDYFTIKGIKQLTCSCKGSDHWQADC